METFVQCQEARLWVNISDTINNNKPYICFCNGGPGVGDYLGEIDELLLPRFNIIRFEQRGCGRSTKDNQYSIETTLSDMDEIRKYFHIDSWYLLGHSWGAGIALFYALRYQQHSRGVVYISGIGVQNDNDWTEEFNRNSHNLAEPEIQVSEDEINFDVTNAGLCSFNKFIQAPMLLKELSNLHLPVLAICGNLDIRPLWPVTQLANLLPCCTQIILNDCNHFLWRQKPLQLRDEVIGWLDSINNLT